METNISKAGSTSQLTIDEIVKREHAFYKQGHYKEALDVCLQIMRTHPQLTGAWINAAINCVMLARWQDAINYAQTALVRGSNELELYDALAHAHGNLGQWDETRRYGLQALNIRASRFSGEPAVPMTHLSPMPPLPSAQTRGRNIIAFSLFGGDSRYCEPAVLNVQEQPQVYPYWTCRFYVDGSVPEMVINRLQAGGAQIVRVEGAALQWPGPMWRLLALDDPQAHRILFRDADSVISLREAAAVEQWLTSGKRFHMMRDWGSHAELILAGLWGTVAGSLPPLDMLMQRFLSTPLQSKHFADQHFLRQYVWPYARTSLMQHDSIFGFMDAVPFPDGQKSNNNFHVGCVESTPVFSVKSDQPDESEVIWELYRTEKRDNGQLYGKLICSYPRIVKEGCVKAHIPVRYVRWIKEGTAAIRLIGNGAA